VLSPSYNCVTKQIYTQQIMFRSVSYLKIRVNGPNIKFNGNDIICVCMSVFAILQFASKFRVYNIE